MRYWYADDVVRIEENDELDWNNGGEFKFRTLHEANIIAVFLSKCFPDPDVAFIGILEMMINAVEHGNLNIGHEHKKALVIAGSLYCEIDNRLEMAEYKEKSARVSIEKFSDKIVLTISDDGAGFDWSDYLEISKDRLADPTGRGVAIAGMMSFDSIEYQGCGNIVVCAINL